MTAPNVSSKNEIMLELKDVHSYYGKIHALKGLSFTVGRGESTMMRSAR